MLDEFGELMSVLDDGVRDPVQAVERMKRARALAIQIGRRAPYDRGRLYLPGLSMPATGIVETVGIGPVAAGGTPSKPFKIEMLSPGVVVGLLLQTREATDAAQAGLDWQLTVENKYGFANDGDTTSGSFASATAFSRFAPWIPVMLPVRGSGGWSVLFRNNGANDVTPIFNLAILNGVDALRRCGFSVEAPSS